MPRVFYEPSTKEAIINAAAEARKADKTWQDAHTAAKAAGYQGSLQGIIKLMRAVDGRGGKPGRKPGRPAGSRGPGRPRKAVAAAASTGGSNSGDIASLVNNLVKARINEALDRAIASLQGAKS
jgi:hypothetical protein